MWFQYRLRGYGWAEAGIGDGHLHASLTASYVRDALGDLLYAVWRLLEGDDEVGCSWAEEPGEYRWIMRREDQSLWVRVLWFDDDDPSREDRLGEVVFETRHEPFAFASAIAAGASKTLQELGEAGYAERWHAPFPTRTLELIDAHLRPIS